VLPFPGGKRREKAPERGKGCKKSRVTAVGGGGEQIGTTQKESPINRPKNGDPARTKKRSDRGHKGRKTRGTPRENHRSRTKRCRETSQKRRKIAAKIEKGAKKRLTTSRPPGNRKEKSTRQGAVRRSLRTADY